MLWPTAIDLFCGCGGVTEGLKASRFRVLAAVDNDPIACQTYNRNHRTVKLYNSDITQIDPARVRSDVLGSSELDLLVVCAPCQPFSSQNRNVVPDGRVSLLLESLRFIDELRPRVVFFENVPGLKRARFSELLEKLRFGLESRGYHLSATTTVDAADYGVPQRRLRCIMLASRGKNPLRIPSPLTPKSKRVTVKHAIGKLPRLYSGQASKSDPLHFSRRHSLLNLERLKFIPKNGGSRRSLPEHLQLACHKDHRGHPDVYGRMKWNDVSPTLTTGCTDLTRGRFVHPRDDRAISLREAARLQTFPDDYKFVGSVQEIASQIGNAVPVKFVSTIAYEIRAHLQNWNHDLH